MATNVTPETIDAAIAPTLDAFVASAAPSLRACAEAVYEQLLYSVQDYLRDNAQWNIGAELERCRKIEAENRSLREMQAVMLDLAYQYLSDLRHPPTGDSLQRRIERAEKVIARATGAA